MGAVPRSAAAREEVPHSTIPRGHRAIEPAPIENRAEQWGRRRRQPQDLRPPIPVGKMPL